MAVTYDYILDDLRQGFWKDATQFFSGGKYIRPIETNRAMYIGDATTVPLIFSGEIAIFESDNTGGTYYPIVNHGSGVGSITAMVGTHGTSDAPTYKDNNQLLGGYAFGGLNSTDAAYNLAGLATGVWGITDDTVTPSLIPMSLHLGPLPLFSNAGLRITSANDILFFTTGGGSGAVSFRTDFSDNRFYFGTGDNSWFDNSGTLTINGAYTFPTTDGTGNQVLTTDGAGTVTWETVSGGGGGLDSKMYEIDEATDTITYIGKADVGTATSDPNWQIVKVTRVDDDYTRELADGNTSYDNIWDDRAALTYS